MAMSSVAGDALLRDRLLQEARRERQRCLEVASRTSPIGTLQASFRAEARPATKEREIQTDPVTVLIPGSGSTLPAPFSASLDKHEDAAQEEALRTLSLLREKKQSSTQDDESRLRSLEAELAAEKASRRELAACLEGERGKKEAAQQQVICLEYELDGKEAALQVAERTLDRRDGDLQQAQLQLKILTDRLEGQRRALATTLVQGQPQPYVAGQRMMPDDARLAALQASVLDRTMKVNVKDQCIENLLAMIRQRGGLEEDRSTACGSERSSARNSTAASTYTYRSSLA